MLVKQLPEKGGGVPNLDHELTAVLAMEIRQNPRYLFERGALEMISQKANPAQYGITGCKLCGAAITRMCVFVPFNQDFARRIGQPAGKTRIVIYGLCDICYLFARPQRESRGGDPGRRRESDSLLLIIDSCMQAI